MPEGGGRDIGLLYGQPIGVDHTDPDGPDALPHHLREQKVYNALYGTLRAECCATHRHPWSFALARPEKSEEASYTS
jgi:hypothetical protein